MLKVTDEKVMQAWEGFEDYLISTGIFPDKGSITSAYKLAFKHGFVEGYNELQPMFVAPTVDIPREELEKMIGEINKSPITFESPTYSVEVHDISNQMTADLFSDGRQYKNGKKTRNSHTATDDSYKLSQVLLNAGVCYTNQEIVDYMNSIGKTHWNNGNASSFIAYAIDKGYPIEKVARGLWKHKKVIVTF